MRPPKLLLKRDIGYTWFLVSILSMNLSLVLPAVADEKQDQASQTLFTRYCQDCHGLEKDGKGALRLFLEQSPADLTSQATQTKSDKELFSIIKHGGGVEMHGWADTFSDEQILGLVRYIRMISPME
jgi:mono/diheme cytochrome c family protein